LYTAVTGAATSVLELSAAVLPASASPFAVPPFGTIAPVEVTGPADVQTLDRTEAELEDVERALARLDEGSYGACEACGGLIGDDRLAQSPLTRRCAEHVSPAAPGAPALH
jgi:hypothetical protein